MNETYTFTHQEFEAPPLGTQLRIEHYTNTGLEIVLVECTEVYWLLVSNNLPKITSVWRPVGARWKPDL